MYYTPFPHSSTFRCIARRPDASGRRLPIKALLCGPGFINCKDQNSPLPTLSSPPAFPFPRGPHWVNSKQVPPISEAGTFGFGNIWSRNRWCGLKQTLKRRIYQKLRRIPPHGILICISCSQRFSSSPSLQRLGSHRERCE